MFFSGPANGVGVASVDALGAQNPAGKRNHIGNIYAEGAVAAPAEHTVPKDKLSHFFHLHPAYPAVLFVEPAQ